MSHHSLSRAQRQDSSGEGIWQQVRLLSDAEFKRLEGCWEHHTNALQATIGPACPEVTGCELIFFGTTANWPFFVWAQDGKLGRKVWKTIESIWTRSALPAAFVAVATLYPFEGKMRIPSAAGDPLAAVKGRVDELVSSAASPEELCQRGYSPLGYAPHLSRWIVEVPCLVGDLVRVAERRREMAQQAAAAIASEAERRRAKPSAAKRPAFGRRSTKRGEARAKLIAALTLHHRYAQDGPPNLEPIGLRELAKLAGVSKSAAWRFFRTQFGGYKKYCHQKTIIRCLELLNGDARPRDWLTSSGG